MLNLYVSSQYVVKEIFRPKDQRHYFIQVYVAGLCCDDIRAFAMYRLLLCYYSITKHSFFFK